MSFSESIPTTKPIGRRTRVRPQAAIPQTTPLRKCTIHGSMTYMARNVIGLSLMLLGPWVVWLSFTHVFHDVGGHRDWHVAVLCGLSVMVGSSGSIILSAPFSRWPLIAKLAGYVIYGTALAFVMPWIAILSFCTAGDCL